MHGGRVVARALKREGVQYVFTLCGGHVMSIYDGCLDEGIGIIDVRHEQSAAHAADGWARVTGQPGVAIVTAGPGLTDAVTGVATAWRANIPLICIGGQAPRAFQDMGGLQDMAHVDLMRPITKWAVSVPAANRLGEYVATAFRVATTNVPGPVFLEMPLDLLFDNVDDKDVVEWQHTRTQAGVAPDPHFIEAAFEYLRGAQRPACLVGSQLFWSKRRDAYPEFVKTFGMPVYVNGQARGSLDPDDPHWFLQTRKDALKKADVVLIFGTPLDFRIGYGRERVINPAAKLIQVDLDGRELGRNRPCDVGIIGDTGLVMAALTQLAKDSKFTPELSRPWLAELRAIEKKKWEGLAPQLTSDEAPLNPLRVCAEVDTFLTKDTIVIGDGGDFVGSAANVLRPRGFGHWLDAGPLGTLGAGPGYAMAAKLASPKSDVIIMYGDGAFGLNMMEFEACIRQKINIVGIIGNDAAWTQILRGQVQIYGPDRTPACKLAPTRYDLMIEAMGGHGEWVERPDQLRPAIQRALGAGKPAVVNVRIGASDFRKDAISV
ncbi:MAG TPA: thiamine pyrophosphate-binding protein [Candidatus Eisenbacteria bacterium]|nr:thiamine pyrophosphate-binding protein [Candidatus Eisenbacteria bacterium]